MLTEDLTWDFQGIPELDPHNISCSMETGTDVRRMLTKLYATCVQAAEGYQPYIGQSVQQTSSLMDYTPRSYLFMR